MVRACSSGLCLKALENLLLAQSVVALLGALVDAVDYIICRWDAVPLQPEQHVRFPAHGADVDDLIQAEHMGRHARVDRVRQHYVVLVICLDDCGCMNTRSSA